MKKIILSFLCVFSLSYASEKTEPLSTVSGYSLTSDAAIDDQLLQHLKEGNAQAIIVATKKCPIFDRLGWNILATAVEKTGEASMEVFQIIKAENRKKHDYFDVKNTFLNHAVFCGQQIEPDEVDLDNHPYWESVRIGNKNRLYDNTFSRFRVNNGPTRQV